MRGEPVTVITRQEVGRDPGNAPIYADVATVVEDVLVAPGPRSDVIESNRPEGVKIAWTLHFPKLFTGSLRGARISVRGQKALPVVGDPQPYALHLTPTRWNRPVELEDQEG